MIEPEIAFANLSDDADLAEDFLKVFSALLDERGDDMAFFQQRVDKGCIERLEKFVDASFERMDYTDAIARLEKAVADEHKFEFPVNWGMDLQSEHERWLTEEHIGRPVVVMNYPKDIKAFYMRMNDDGNTVAAMDVLAPGIGEIIGGSQREERLDVLDARLEGGFGEGRLLVVPRPAQIRHCPARRLRPRLRAHPHLRHRHSQRTRRDSIPADTAFGGVLKVQFHIETDSTDGPSLSEFR